jgi:hypothetical protein
MPKTKPTADEIAEIASRGEDVSAHFTNKFIAVKPERRVNAGPRSKRRPASNRRQQGTREFPEL